MGANSFSKEEKVLFAEQILAFEDALDAAGLIRVKKLDATDLARSNDACWVPAPYIMTSNDGLDQSGNFAGKTQLSVPLYVNRYKSVPFQLDGLELRDALQEKRLFDGALEKLASDVNLSAIQTISLNSSLTIKRSGAASGFDDLAACSVMLDQNGVPASRRKAMLNSADYLGCASDLSKASRSLIGDISPKALQQAYVGDLAGISTFRESYTLERAAAAGAGITATTLAAGVNVYVPRSTTSSGDGNLNVDNRRQTMTFSSTTGMVAGDRFTIANVFNVHPITKQSTGVLKTFVVISIASGTTAVVSPPMISAQNGEEAAKQYQNCTVSTASGTAAVVFLNTTTKQENYFFHEDAILISPSSIAFPEDAGCARMSATTKNGISVVMLKQASVETGTVKYRADARWGVNCVRPEASGVILFSQA